jgi:hypothetical protein
LIIVKRESDEGNPSWSSIESPCTSHYSKSSNCDAGCVKRQLIVNKQFEINKNLYKLTNNSDEKKNMKMQLNDCQSIERYLNLKKTN